MIHIQLSVAEAQGVPVGRRRATAGGRTSPSWSDPIRTGIARRPTASAARRRVSRLAPAEQAQDRWPGLEPEEGLPPQVADDGV
jgi:hypothetical protein